MGLCPSCLRQVPARIFADAGQIRIARSCPVHGDAGALIASDAAEYLRLRQYVPDRSGAKCCCGPGDSCGGGPPVCALLVEITQACNLRCPTCFADAHGHEYMSVDEVGRRLHAFFAKQPTLDVLMLSGGEPTIHPQFAEILALALAYPVQRILINTNGLRLVQSDTLLSTLAAHKQRVELSLSFSSFRADVHERFYGRDLRAGKELAVQRARETGLFVTLVPVIERGVNDDEIGDLYRFALSQENVNGLTFQPVMTAGRYEHDYDPNSRMTLTDIVTALEDQSNGALVRSDFVGLPCSHPDCCALTYGFLDAARTSIAPLPRYLDVARYMELFSDRMSFAGLIGGALRRIWSDMTHLRAAQTLRDLGSLYDVAGIRDVLPLIGRPREFGARVLRIVIKPFMDAYTYDRRRIEQCCTKIVDEDGRAISLCEYNVFRRGGAAALPKRGTIPLTVVSSEGDVVKGLDGRGAK